MLNRQGQTPLWALAIIIIAALPVFSFPALLTSAPSDLRAIVWLYPLYVLTAAWLAWACWPTRRLMSWILIVLMLLSHGAMWMLATMPLS